jgi:ADP-ribose pyrophosphatase YjhB (NUDIX family)
MGDYMRELRVLVGKRPLILPGAALVVLDGERRVLLGRRMDSGVWGLPAGLLELGERLEDAARREAREEIGIEVGEMTLAGVFSGPERFHRYANGDEVYNVTAVYVTTDWRGEAVADGVECPEARFFAGDALPAATGRLTRAAAVAAIGGATADATAASAGGGVAAAAAAVVRGGGAASYAAVVRAGGAVSVTARVEGTADYITDLRALVGNRPLILPGATVFILDGIGPERRLLLQRRTDNGAWGLPGGFLELGERLEDTARREAREEIGVEVGEMTLVGAFSGLGLFHRYANGDEVFNVTIAYVTSDYRGEVRVDGKEATQARFFPLDALPADISPPIRPVIESFVSGGWATPGTAGGERARHSR